MSTLPTAFDFWEQEIDAAISVPDPALSNIRITRVHYLLSQALGQVLHADAGANFHAWAVWGSRKAGVTIRQEDLESAIRNGATVAGTVGTLVAAVGGALLQRRVGRIGPAGWAVGLAAGAAAGALAGWRLAIDSRGRASRLILEGNRTVLSDIGRLSARFIARFADEPSEAPEHLDAFLEEVRPGRAGSGGQDLLRRAFTQYHRARYARDTKSRQEAAYFGNCLSVYHEHVRLQPYIQASLPHIIRKCVTKRMMTYDVGSLRFSVGEDVPALNGCFFPEHLEALSNAELTQFLTGPEDWNVPLTSLQNTRATDWTRIRQRMAYVFALFRALHTEPSVFRAPYSEDQFAEVLAGRLPTGPL